MQITKSNIQHLSILIFVLVGVLVWVLMCGGAATAGPYTDSAHGSNSYGVNRSGTGYAKGDCVNCHDSCDNEFMLFAPMNPISQTDNFCFQCHKGDGSVQVGGVINNDYGSTFGGGTTNSTNIKDAFAFGPPVGNPGSSHNLKKLRNWTNGKNFAPWVTVDTNACIICHDPHFAQKNTGVDPHPLGGVKTAIRRTVDGGDNTRNQWGDEPLVTSGLEEMMSDYTSLYQAPIYYPWAEGKTQYEPANNSTSDGSNLPNFVDFCYSKCHIKAIPASKTDAGTGTRDLIAINWESDGDQHGKRHTPNHVLWENTGGLKAPYNADAEGNGEYVLSCTDCHEPHGSPNEWLLRTSVNGKDNINWAAQDGFLQFCTACHWLTLQHDSGTCGTCHYHGSWYDRGPIF